MFEKMSLLQCLQEEKKTLDPSGGRGDYRNRLASTFGISKPQSSCLGDIKEKRDEKVDVEKKRGSGGAIVFGVGEDAQADHPHRGHGTRRNGCARGNRRGERPQSNQREMNGP